MLKRIGLFLILAACVGPSRARAQSGLRVLRYTPSDSGTPSSLITVTFDRPVAGMLGRSIDAAKVMRIEPPVAGLFEWRDPITLRFIPANAFAPGTQVTVAVDTAAIASSGARTGVHYLFSVRFPGPTPLSHAVEGRSQNIDPVGPRPTFAVLYSAPVDLAAVNASSRVVFPDSCGGVVVPLRVVRQRHVIDADRAGLYEAFPYGRDTTGEGFQRVVELVPQDSLPAGCAGYWSVVPFDVQRPSDVWRYKVRTYPAFTVSGVVTERRCFNRFDDSCNVETLSVHFSAPTYASRVAAALRSTPTMQLPGPAPHGTEPATTIVRFANPLLPREHYTVALDTSLRDVYGRALQVPVTRTLTVPDRPAGVKQQNGLVSLARTNDQSVSVSVRTVNVDTLIMLAIPIPDSLTPLLLSLSNRRRPELLPRLQPTLKDTIRVVVPIHGEFNKEGNTTIHLPTSLTRAGAPSMFGVRFEIQAASIAPDSQHTVVTRRASEARARRNAERSVVSVAYSPGFGMIVQVSPWVAHLKIANNQGAVFVTDRSGDPVPNVLVSLRSGRNEIVSQGITNEDGLVTLAKATRTPSVKTVRVISRDASLDAMRYIVISRDAERLIVPFNSPIPTTLSADLDAYSLGARSGTSSSIRGTVTPDRDLYRPGEMVYGRLIVRTGTLGRTSTPVAIPVRVSLVRGDYFENDSRLVSASDEDVDTIGVWTAKLSRFGTATDSIRIPPTAKPGSHALVAEAFVDGAWQAVAESAISVKEFRPPEFLVTLAPDTALRFTGDTVAARLSATYLFGAPMAGATVRWAAHSTPAYGIGRTIPTTLGFVVGRHDWWENDAQPEAISMQGSATLNSKGHLDLRIPTTAGSLSQPSLLNIAVAVDDITTRSVTTSGSTYLQPSSVFVAVKDRNAGWYWKPDILQTLDVMVVRPTGERVSGVPLRVTVVRRSYQRDTTSGAFSQTLRWTADTVLRWSMVSADTLVPITYTPTTEGAFDVRVEATDDQGRAVTTNIGKFAYRAPWFAANGVNAHTLKVTTQRPPRERFGLGDTALVSFESPFVSADAWITLEREGVLEQRRLTVAQGSTTVAVPIAERLAPNVWVGITLIKRGPGALTRADTVASLLRAGYVELRVDSTAHMLRVEVVPTKTELTPGSIAEVRVRVRDANPSAQRTAQPTEVALWAVDEGVLSMSGFRTPDVLNAVDAHLGVAPSMRTSLTQLPWLRPAGAVLPGVNVSFGMISTAMATSSLHAVTLSDSTAGAVSAGAVLSVGLSPRATFRLTAFYIGNAVTDRTGLAIIRARLPQNISTFRLMASAVGTGNRYGSGDAPLLVARRVVLRPALPRFLRAGDSLQAVAALNVRSSSGAFRVSVKATHGVKSSDASHEVQASAGQGGVARFTITVPEQIRSAESHVTFTAAERGSNDGDAISTAIPIRPTGTPRTHTVIGSVSDSGSVTIDLPEGIDLERSRLTLGLGTSPVVAMRSHYDQLRAYAHYATDGVVAAARALLVMSNAEGALGERIIARDSIAVAADVQVAVNTLLARYLPDAGFRWFPTSSITVGPWLTAYAGMFLLDAQRAGVKVPATTFENITGTLERVLIDGRLLPDTVTGSLAERQRALRRSLGTRLVIAQYLRRAGKPNVAGEDSLISLFARLAWEDRVSLTELMAARADRAAQARELLDGLWKSTTVAGRRVDLADSLFGGGVFPSRIRPASRLLTATVTLFPSHPLLGALGETIVQQSAAERGWAWNVHDHASAIEALAVFIRDQRTATNSRIVVRTADGRMVLNRATDSVGRSGLAGDTTSVSVQSLMNPTTAGSAPRALSLRVVIVGASATTVRKTPLYFAMSVHEVPRVRPITPDIAGIVVERWYERFEDGTPIIEATEGDLVRVHLRVTVPADRQFVAMEDLLPAGLEAIDVSYRTSSELGPFAASDGERTSLRRSDSRPGPFWQGLLYGSWDGGWWSPWEVKEIRDDRVFYFSRQLWTGTYNTSYVARATTAGVFVRPPAHAEEMYNPALQGRSDGGVFRVMRRE